MNKFLSTAAFVLLSGSLAFAENVLIIGDSHSYGPLGTVLDNHYRNKGYGVTSYASCGSSPSTWIRTSQNFKSTNCGFWSKDLRGKEVRVNSHKLPSLSEAMNKAQPAMTVISLGTNILASPANITQEVKHIEKMATEIKNQGSECIWIGPPDLRKNPFKANLGQGVPAIKKAVEAKGCKFIDSREITKYPGGKNDGIHYGPGDSRKWGEALVNKLSFPKSAKSATNADVKSKAAKEAPKSIGVQ